ncbi:response regulator [Burkholderiaceae bacterium FT117]|uniref:response regulator transcription factor n=1 Tax=Zeimonas sediminis TaxID=2944268 RepID=UPI0023431937|nr:response regulator [Zeimonas sediminis]MCM5570422.1 response regulator [Zeimonas sediminis]
MKKVLIAEDQAHIRTLIERSIEELEDDGVEILVAPDGTTALSTILEARPDVVLLDVMMPGMNGFEVCESLRRDEAARHAHVIFLTAKGQEYDRARAREVGANGYLIKPFDPDALLAAVRQALGFVDE